MSLADGLTTNKCQELCLMSASSECGPVMLEFSDMKNFAGGNCFCRRQPLHVFKSRTK